MEVTIQISDELRKRLETLASYRKVAYDELFNNLLSLCESAIFLKTEKEFAEWFERSYRVFGFERVIKKNKFGTDYALEDFNGKNVRVELELLAQHFIFHKHKPQDVDVVICAHARPNEQKIKGIPIWAINISEYGPGYKGMITIALSEKVAKDLKLLKIKEGHASLDKVIEKILTEYKKKKFLEASEKFRKRMEEKGLKLSNLTK